MREIEGQGARFELLGGGSEVAGRSVWPNLQRAEDGGDIRRLDRSPILAADACMDQVNITAAPVRAALFDRQAIVGTNGKFHGAEVAAPDEIAPSVALSRHLVHVREVLAQIGIAGVDIAVLPLMTDRADIIRIEYQDIGLDCQNSKVIEDQVMRNI